MTFEHVFDDREPQTADALTAAEQSKAPKGSTIRIQSIDTGYFYYLYQTMDIKDIRVVYAPPTMFRTELSLDSLDLVEFVARIEQRFGIMIPDEDVAQLASLAATERYLGGRLAP